MSAHTVRIRSVEPLDGFVVRLSFADGTTREIDLEGELWGPVFEPRRADRELFREVRVDDLEPAETAATAHVSHAER